MKTDVAIVGGGPAGSTLATLLVQAGYEVVILEKESFPRYRVGESLLPASVRDLARMLDIDEALPEVGFVQKRGATFAWGANQEDLWHLNFGGSRSLEPTIGPDVPAAYNVDRARFDRVLLDNAIAKGVTVKYGCKATDFLHGTDRVAGIAFTDEAGEKTEINARFSVDASGQKSKLARHIGKRTLSRFFEKLAVWEYYDNGKRLADPLSGNTFFHAVDDAWLWYIPLSDTLTSVGVVAPASDWHRGISSADYLHQKIESCTVINDLLCEATRTVSPPYDETRVCSEYSYCSDSFWKPGVFTLGDSSCFIDVLLASGVHMATYGAVLAAQSLHSVMSGIVSEEVAMNEYETRVRREFAIFFNGLVGLYDMTLQPEDYTAWLRKLLIDTSGITFEAETLLKEPVIPDNDKLLCRVSQYNLKKIRQYNDQQLAYAGEPGRTENGLPPLIHTLVSTPDLRLWQRVL